MIKNKKIISAILTLVTFSVVFVNLIFSSDWLEVKAGQMYQKLVDYFETPEEKEKREEKEKEKKRENYRAEFFEQMACKPDVVLSNEELFENSMQDYWKMQVNEVRFWDEKFRNEDDDVPDNLNEIICKLNDKSDTDRSFSAACYPWRMYQYDTLEKISKWANFKDDIDFIGLVRDEWQGKYFIPSEYSVYKTTKEDYSVPFSVIWRQHDVIQWYPRDCCKLLDYNYLLRNRFNFHLRWAWEVIPLEDLSKEDFLLVKSKRIDDLIKDYSGLNSLGKGKEYNLEEKNYIYMVYPVSKCGKIVKPIL